jgi:hypothetical protein
MKNMKILTQIKTEESWRRKTPWTVTKRNSTDDDGETRTKGTLFGEEKWCSEEKIALRNGDGTK